MDSEKEEKVLLRTKNNWPFLVIKKTMVQVLKQLLKAATNLNNVN